MDILNSLRLCRYTYTLTDSAARAIALNRSHTIHVAVCCQRIYTALSHTPPPKSNQNAKAYRHLLAHKALQLPRSGGASGWSQMSAACSHCTTSLSSSRPDNPPVVCRHNNIHMHNIITAHRTASPLRAYLAQCARAYLRGRNCVKAPLPPLCCCTLPARSSAANIHTKTAQF